MSKNVVIGRRGEQWVKTFFENKGYEIIAENVHTLYGEIDLIIRLNTELIFVEVKSRTNLSYGFPESAISKTKLEHMVNSAEAFLADHPEITCPWRIDVVALNFDPKKHEPEMEWFENVVDQ